MPAYHRPETLDDALGLMAQGGFRVAAGCTDLFPQTQARALPWSVVDITAIAALRGIERVATGWRIGGSTTWTEILKADLPPAFDGLKLAAREVGSVQIQNAGTLAGNLCTASPAGDGIPCLMTLEAAVELASKSGRRQMPLAEFLTGARQTALQPEEIVTAIHVPDLAGQGDFLKLGARKYLVISIAMVATRVLVAERVIKEIAVAVGACSAVATRLRALEAALVGCPVVDAPARVTRDLVAPNLTPIDDIRADAGYRLTAATELVSRSLARVVEGQGVAA